MKLLVSGIALGLVASSFALTYTGGGFAASSWGYDEAAGIEFNSSDIAVTGTGLTVDAIRSVTLIDFQHGWAGDLRVGLYNVDRGVFVDLFAPGRGAPSAGSRFGGSYTFVVDPTIETIDETIDGMGVGFQIPTGTYAPNAYGGGTKPGPRTNFDAFAGLALDGVWSLRFVDSWTGVDYGSLGSWKLEATPRAVPEPASVAALGLGALAVVRRRKKA